MPSSATKMYIRILAAFLVVSCLFVTTTTTTTATVATPATATNTSGGDNSRYESLFLPTDIIPEHLTYKLSLFWLQGYCKTKESGCEGTSTASLPDHFTMHGLWPIYTRECVDSTEEFSIDQVSDIMDSLKKNWPAPLGYKKPDKNAEFWGHEWKKHGTRCGIFGSVRDYFQQSLELLGDFNVLQILVEAGTPTRPEDVKAAFPGREPYVLCKKGKDEVSYFFQIEFCLDSNKAYINCNPPEKVPKTHCPEGEDFSYGTTTITTGTLFFEDDVEKLIYSLPLPA